MCRNCQCQSCFFFNDTATTEIYTLSLHDALPILAAGNAVVSKPSEHTPAVGAWLAAAWRAAVPDVGDAFQGGTGAGENGAAACRAGVEIGKAVGRGRAETSGGAGTLKKKTN